MTLLASILGPRRLPELAHLYAIRYPRQPREDGLAKGAIIDIKSVSMIRIQALVMTEKGSQL